MSLSPNEKDNKNWISGLWFLKITMLKRMSSSISTTSSCFKPLLLRKGVVLLFMLLYLRLIIRELMRHLRKDWLRMKLCCSGIMTMWRSWLEGITVRLLFCRCQGTSRNLWRFMIGKLNTWRKSMLLMSSCQNISSYVVMHTAWIKISNKHKNSTNLSPMIAIS